MPSDNSNLKSSSACGVDIRDLTIAFDPQRPVLDKLCFGVAPGEIVALVGASGSGKSTLLRAIARLVEPNSGSIEFCPGPPSRRLGDLAYVFQDATLLPWRTVYENVALPLELGKRAAVVVTRTSAKQLGTKQSGGSSDTGGAACVASPEVIFQTLASVGLQRDVAAKFPRQLSGGMRMRTSIARALVTDPNILLLDEPFAALDDLLRSRMNDLVLQLWQQRSRTVLFVTHNIAEAVYLSHRIAVLGRGRVGKVIDNHLSWPRESGQRSSVEFASLYGSVSAALSEVSL